MTSPIKNHPVSVRLPPDLQARLEAAAAADYRSLSSEMCKRLTKSFEPGISLRDQLAMHAMPEVYQRVNSGGFARVAQLAYELADAMLIEGSKKQETHDAQRLR